MPKILRKSSTRSMTNFLIKKRVGNRVKNIEPQRKKSGSYKTKKCIMARKFCFIRGLKEWSSNVIKER